MTPEAFLHEILDPGLAFVEEVCGIKRSDSARVMLLTIAGQESNWTYRMQQGGPARSHFQFEQGGGVHGVLQHAASKDKARLLCAECRVEPVDDLTVYTCMTGHDFLAVGMARLLLWTDARSLPPATPAGQQAGWEIYNSVWRPGSPHPDVWPGHWQASLAAIAKPPPVG